MQRELAEREARNRAVIESLAEGMVVQDSEGRIVAWNESAERILGLTGDQLAGRTSMDPAWCAIDPREVPIAGDQHPIVRARVNGEHVDPLSIPVEDSSRKTLDPGLLAAFKRERDRVDVARSDQAG